MVAADMPADAILTSVLDKSGYLAELHGSNDPQDETRLENLRELITVAREFVSGVATLTVPEDELDELGLADEAAGPTDPEDELAAALDPEADLAAGAAEPDASLGSFLERVALVADSDQIPDAPDRADSGVVTLMTLHTAKGLEFDTVFLTGCEDGVFPTSARDRRPYRRRACGGAAARVRGHHTLA
jgi:DNA helicase-2/ATP-dependent DNA helicase PcrA